MLKLRYLLLLIIVASSPVCAQRDYNGYVREGNKLYADSLFDKAEIVYRKALEKDVNGTAALYNLGNTLLMQQKAQDAMSQYQIAEKREDSTAKLAQIHHNMGVIHHGSNNYAAAVETYKQALRENPHDHETRYNLALAMHMLKQQQQNENQEQQQQEKQEKQEQEQQQQQQQQQNQQQEQQQQMSKENAEQMLQAAMQDEKDVQEKVKKMMQVRGRKLEKDW